MGKLYRKFKPSKIIALWNNYKTLAQKGGTTSPLYADNETQLLAKLNDAIKQAISGRLTFTIPAVMSDVSKGDFIYQATFEYEKNKQWNGSVKKYKLNSILRRSHCILTLKHILLITHIAFILC